MKKTEPKSCNLLEIVTPKRFQLYGLWFGATKPKRVVIFVHGLGSSAFSTNLAKSFVDKETATVTFSNRGSSTVTRTRRLDNTKKGYSYVTTGSAHEVFTDCVDDIQGVIDLVNKNGIKDIYLVGHSTGCQKSVYYASRKDNQKKLKGIILLAPLSDYSIALKNDVGGNLAEAVKMARELVKKGLKHELLPMNITSYAIDAQRFLSLNTPDSAEEIFTYAQPKKNPRVLMSLNIPVLTILAKEDEYGDRPAEDIARWFDEHTHSRKYLSKIIKGATHGFNGKESSVAREIGNWANWS